MPSRNVTPKQPKASVLRAKRKREPQVHENAKTAIIIKGRKTSQNVTDALKDLVSGTASHNPQPNLDLPRGRYRHRALLNFALKGHTAPGHLRYWRAACSIRRRSIPHSRPCEQTKATFPV